MVVYILQYFLMFPGVASFNFLPNTTEKQSICINNVINHVFPIGSTIVFIYDHTSARFKVFSNKYTFIGLNFQTNLDLPKMEMNIQQEKAFVIFGENSTDLLHTINKIQTTSIWHSCFSIKGKFLVFVTCSNCLDDVFLMLWKLKIIYVITVNQPSDACMIYSASPFFDRNKFGSAFKEKIIETSNNLAITKFYSVPKKLNHCSLRILSLDTLFDFPFLYHNNKNEIFGLLVEPLKLIGTTINCTVRFDDDPHNFQGIFANTPLNFTELEIAKDRQPADIVAATPNRFSQIYNYCKHTKIFLYDKYFWIVPKPEMMPNIKVIVNIYRWNTWAFILIVVFLTAFIWHLLTDNPHCKSVLNSFLCIYKISLGVSYEKPPKSFNQRLFFFIYLTYSLQLCWQFQTKLSSVLTSPNFEKGVRSLNDLLETDLTPYMVEIHKLSLAMLNSSNVRRLESKAKVRPRSFSELDSLKYVGEHRNISTQVLRAYLQAYPELRKKIITFGSEFLGGVEASYWIKMSHPLKDKIDEVISWLIEAGFPQKFVMDLDSKVFEVETKDFRVIITFEHLQGSFLILGTGVLLSVCIFVIENFARCKKTKL